MINIMIISSSARIHQRKQRHQQRRDQQCKSRSKPEYLDSLFKPLLLELMYEKAVIRVVLMSRSICCSIGCVRSIFSCRVGIGTSQMRLGVRYADGDDETSDDDSSCWFDTERPLLSCEEPGWSAKMPGKKMQKHIVRGSMMKMSLREAKRVDMTSES